MPTDTLRDLEVSWTEIADHGYDNPDVNVYLQDLRRITKDDSETYQNQQWARGILTKFIKSELKREDFLLVCRRLDQI